MTLTSRPDDKDKDAAGPSTSTTTTTTLTPGESSYHESSQFLHWRYSPSTLSTIRHVLNMKSAQTVRKNKRLEKEAQLTLNHETPTLTNNSSTTPSTYLTVSDELLLVKFYCVQISKICKHGFGLPEVVESTAISYLKRFYLKNSVMEWHPKTIMPTCLFLAAKTTNYPVLIDTFIPKFAKLTAADVIDTEFLVAQSLGFEFWIRGAEKAVRGWSLDMQNQPNASTNTIETIQKSLPTALNYLSTSRLTDIEFIYTPSQIGLAVWYLSNPSLIDKFLDERYKSWQGEGELYGSKKDRLKEIVNDIIKLIQNAGDGEVDMKKVKEVDKRLKACSNPEKVPGTALYAKRKREKESAEIENKKAKNAKAQAAAKDRDSVFGGLISSGNDTTKLKGVVE